MEKDGASLLAKAAATTARAKHVLFLSHAGIDSEAALRLAQRLEESEEAKLHGLKVWIDKTDLAAGGRWKDALQTALAGSTAFAVYVGSRGVVNWVWDEVSVALDRAHKEPAYPIIPVLAPGARSTDLPSFLSQYQGIGDPEQPGELQKLLRAVLRLDARAKVALEHEPFVGLRAYTSNKVHLFFGREKETEEVIALLRATPFLLVTGDSGSGKSSLVLAGLAPAFRGGRLGRPHDNGPDETIWHVIETRPGTDPFGRLADSVRAAAEHTGTRPMAASDLADLVRTRQPDKVRDAVLSGAPKGPDRPSKILLVVDQFEEFRTSAQAAAFATTLLHLAAPGDDRIRVVLTMRRDYLYICDSFPDLRERLRSTPSPRYLLHRMSRDGLHAAVTAPLALAGIDEPDREDLARAVLKDVGDEPGELALLQMALWRAWSEAKGKGPDLVRAYDGVGRVEGALAKAAEDVFARLAPDEQQRAETLFVRLVRPGEAGGATRRVARLDEFEPSTIELAGKLSQEEQWRLLTIHENTVEIAHEQLATQWLRYQRWIANIPADPQHGAPPDLRGDDLRLLQALIAEAARWEAVSPNRKAEFLATGVNLELYAQLDARRQAWLSNIERRFVQASESAEQARVEHEQTLVAERQRLLQERVETEQARAQEQAEAARGAQIQRDIARAQVLAMQARRAGTEAVTPNGIELASALALESIALSRREGRPAEVDAIETVRMTLTALPFSVLRQDSPVTALAVLADGRLASAGDDGQIRLWPKGKAGKPVVLQHGSPVRALAVLADGRLASAGDDGKIRLWPKGEAGKPVVLQHGGAVGALAVLADGWLASGGSDGQIRLWPKDKARKPVVLRRDDPARALPVRALAVLADGRLASGGDDGVTLWPKDRAGKSVVLRRGGIQSLAALADGGLASGGDDTTIKVWHDGDAREVSLRHGGGLKSAVGCLAGLADGRLASGGRDGRIKLWPRASASAKPLYFFRHAAQWPTESAAEPVLLLHGSPGTAVLSLACLADGSLVSGGEDGQIKLWGIDEPTVLRHGRQVDVLVAMTDGRVASANEQWGEIKVWPNDGKGEPAVLRSTLSLTALAILPDDRLASAHPTGRLTLWPKDGNGKPKILEGSQSGTLAVLADGRLASAAYADDDGQIKLWPKPDGGKPVCLRHGSAVHFLAALPDGRFASADFEQIKLWPKDGAQDPAVFQQGSMVRALVAMADGRLVSGDGDGNIKLWPKDGAGEPVVLQHGSSVESLSVLADGRLASGGDDGKIRLWPKDAAGEPVVLQHGSPVTALTQMADGRLASGGDDGQIKLWLVDEHKLIAALCLRAGRNLSNDEWIRYIDSAVPRQPSCRCLPSNWRTP